MKKIFANFGVFLISSLCLFAQETDKLKTKHVIVLIVDGPRYSETWGDSTHQYIPKMANEISKSGVVFTNFYNDGYTYTTSGHTAICTGHKQELENSKGSQLPDYPSIFQYFLKSKKLPTNKAFVITSKDKLQILANCNDEEFHDKHLASTICGVNGMGTGYGNDTTTFRRTMNVLNNEKPDLLLVNFKEPDASGHANNWNGYLKGIRDTDSLVWEIWKFIQQDEYYKNSTTLFVTNDHGRHTDGHKDGFVNHGDHCDGCRHINLFAMGPDFKNNLIENKTFVQVDLTATIAQLLGLKMPYCQGKSIGVLFK